MSRIGWRLAVGVELSRELNRAGTTIVQVTHSEQNAAHGNRVALLRDRWMVV